MNLIILRLRTQMWLFMWSITLPFLVTNM